MGFSLGIGGSIELQPRDRVRTGGEHDILFKRHPPTKKKIVKSPN